MQNEDEQLKTTGGGEKVTWSGKARLWLSVVVEGGDVFLPSLLSSVSLLSPLSSVFFFVIFSFSPLSLRGCQRRLDMAVSAAVRWFVVAVERKHGGSCSCSSSSPCRGASLCFSVFLFLSLLCLFFYFWTLMVLSGVTGRNSGGDGGSSLRWRAVSAAVFPPVQRCRLLLLQGCCSREGRWWEAAGGC